MLCVLSYCSGRTPGYVIEELEPVKKDLNDLRSCLDSIDIAQWKSHTSRTLVTSKVVPAIRRLPCRDDEQPPEMVTNAWCKMYEILRGCQLITPSVVQQRSPPELRSGTFGVSFCILRLFFYCV